MNSLSSGAKPFYRRAYSLKAPAPQSCDTSSNGHASTSILHSFHNNTSFIKNTYTIINARRLHFSKKLYGHPPNKKKLKILYNQNISEQIEEDPVNLLKRLETYANEDNPMVHLAWAYYDRIKLAGYLSLIPVETWRLLFKTCQEPPDRYIGEFGLSSSNIPQAGPTAATNRRIWPQIENVRTHMRLHSVAEDISTYNTLLEAAINTNSESRFMRLIQSLEKLNAWGVVKIDGKTCKSIIHGYHIFEHHRVMFAFIDLVEKTISKKRGRYKDDDREPVSVPGGEVNFRLQELDVDQKLLNVIINSLGQSGRLREALRWKLKFKRFGLKPDEYTFSSLFYSFRKARYGINRPGPEKLASLVETGRQLWQEMLTSGIEPNDICLTNIVALISFDTPKGKADDEPLISSAIQRLETESSSKQNPYGYITLLNHCAKHRDLGSIKHLWNTILTETRFIPRSPLIQPMVLNAYLCALSACGSHRMVLTTFFKLAGAEFHIEPWKIPRGLHHNSRDDLPAMAHQSHFSKTFDRSTFDILIQSCVHMGLYNLAESVLEQMVKHDFVPTNVTLRAMLGASPTTKKKSKDRNSIQDLDTVTQIEYAKNALSTIISTRRRLRQEVSTHHGATRDGRDLSGLNELGITTALASQIIGLAAKCEDLKFGELVFETLKEEHDRVKKENEQERQDQIYNYEMEREEEEKHATMGSIEATIIKNHSFQEGQPRLRHNHYREHIEKFCVPDVYLYSSLLNLYTKLGELRDVINVWNTMDEQGLKPDIVSYTTLLHAFHRAALKIYVTDRESDEPVSNREYVNTDESKTERRNRFISVIEKIERFFLRSANDIIDDISLTEDIPDQQKKENLVDDDKDDFIDKSSRPKIDLKSATMLLRTHSSRLDEVRYWRIEDKIKEKKHRIHKALELCEMLKELEIEPDEKFNAALDSVIIKLDSNIT
ncbi:hypothetical protein H4219_000972 [Mycoemilia scoparia]|uniref:Uncharacterized protein n=1 Tax=Mycoemilia scoparia TaxID=417184 RepID=A0A9W8A7R8_9FUNG|nr:hypothetical protein H4219_000972 [Mycoemilia scoparia]